MGETALDQETFEEYLAIMRDTYTADKVCARPSASCHMLDADPPSSSSQYHLLGKRFLTFSNRQSTRTNVHAVDFNCNSFTNDCLGFLNGGSIPPYIKCEYPPNPSSFNDGRQRVLQRCPVTFSRRPLGKLSDPASTPCSPTGPSPRATESSLAQPRRARAYPHPIQRSRRVSSSLSPRRPWQAVRRSVVSLPWPQLQPQFQPQL